MKNKNFWITLSLLNLCLVALLGLTLRTKFVFPLPFLDYKNFLSAHSHFAFSGWITMILSVLFIEQLLTTEQKKKKVYQWILWGFEINSLGMLISFPFHGYAFFSIIFSTLFIFFTYGFGWVFIKDVLKTNKDKIVKLLSVTALTFLIVSSVGPFTLAYFMATRSGDSFLYRDAVYTFMHFQYNGFFTLSVFALFFDTLFQNGNELLKRRIWQFALFLCISVIPSLFLSLLWHSNNIYVHTLAIAGCLLILVTLFFFSTFAFKKEMYSGYGSRLAHIILVLSMISFGVKMVLQIGTIIPSLGQAVFGFRPIIIGFLHLVFLGFVTFYVMAYLMRAGAFDIKKKISGTAIIYFSIAIIINETILLTDGVGLLFNSTSRIFPWLLWGAAILLFSGAVLLFIARLAARRLK